MTVESIKNADIYLILFALFLKFFSLFCEAFNIKNILKVYGEKITMGRALKYSFIGFFYSSITPSATGGQPMQVYHMKKDGIDIAHSTVTLLLMLCSFHIITLFFMLVGAANNFHYLVDNLHYFSILFVIGIGISIALLTVIMSLIFSPRATELIERAVKKIFRKFKVQNSAEKLSKLEETIKDYRTSSEFLKKNKILFVKILGVTFIQLLAYYSIDYVVMRAFMLSNASLFKMITLHAVLYSSICMIPLPGSLGANELGFKALYKPIFGPLVDSAVITTRFVEFYFYVLISSVVAIVAYAKRNKSQND